MALAKRNGHTYTDRHSNTTIRRHLGSRANLKLKQFRLKLFCVMKISVKTTITVEVDPCDTIDDVKTKVFDQTGIPTGQQRFFTPSGRRMTERRMLSDYNIYEAKEIYVKNLTDKIRNPDVSYHRTRSENDDLVDSDTKRPRLH